MVQIKAGAQTARLITINHDGKSYEIVPGGAGSVPVEIPNAAAKLPFVKALVDSGDLVMGDVAEEDEPDDKLQTLRKEAEALGVKFDGRTGAETLQKKIDEAKAPK